MFIPADGCWPSTDLAVSVSDHLYSSILTCTPFAFSSLYLNVRLGPSSWPDLIFVPIPPHHLTDYQSTLPFDSLYFLLQEYSKGIPEAKMQLPVGLVSLVSLPIALVGATPIEQARVEAGTTCGRTYYSADAVRKASNAACSYVQDGGRAGSSSYPHRYNNFEGFYFQGEEGPFYEFPLMSSGKIYGGGRPGADRVIINEDCKQVGQITHTGASGNNFVGCSGTD
ncbi:hypothetical protein RJ55_02386 [Drechmeria coniospora]|nr:hypothetical protein RJ55_02386 [Drechmeria coniospora]